MVGSDDSFVSNVHLKFWHWDRRCISDLFQSLLYLKFASFDCLDSWPETNRGCYFWCRIAVGKQDYMASCTIPYFWKLKRAFNMYQRKPQKEQYLKVFLGQYIRIAGKLVRSLNCEHLQMFWWIACWVNHCKLLELFSLPGILALKTDIKSRALCNSWELLPNNDF